uniref:F-box domain-containing protein n=1 Tax=Setaria viridis TaxID=4556 RepID=A0A4U6V159_SETVI|nr:hypothetical protein SEVIR_4G086100v2 [Setaria viridis]
MHKQYTNAEPLPWEANLQRRKLEFQHLDLPEDMLCKILSQLPLKEVIRTSDLSSKWRYVRTINPKLRFDGMTMCSHRSIYGSKQCTQEFIQSVNAALQQHNGMFVEDFELKFGLHSELVIHLDDWVRFVTASQTKNLAFDLVPAEFRGRHDRKFDLHLVRATTKDLNVLSSCSSLEWLSMVRCHLDDELKVDLPLPRLKYLCVADSMITGIKVNAMNIETFVYKGWRYPIETRSLDLKDAHLHFFDWISIEDALTILPTVLSHMPTMLENASKFSQLKYLVLELTVSDKDAGNILSLASYLRAAPLVEKFELHFNVVIYPHLDLEPLRSFPQCPRIYLKDLYISGFVACTGQLEFLLHTVENAPGLEILTLDPAPKFDKNVGTEHGQRTDLFSQDVREISIRYLSGRISPTAKLCIL